MTYFPLPPGLATAPLESVTIPPSYSTVSADAPPPAYHPRSRSPSPFPPRRIENELDTSSPRFSAANLRNYSPSSRQRYSTPQRPRKSHPPSHSPSPNPPAYRDESLDTTSPSFTRSRLCDYSSRPPRIHRSNLPPPLYLDTSTRALSPSTLPKVPKGTRPYNPYILGARNRYSQLATPTNEGPSAREAWLWGGYGRWPRSRNGVIASLVVVGLAVVVIVVVAGRITAHEREG